MGQAPGGSGSGGGGNGAGVPDGRPDPLPEMNVPGQGENGAVEPVAQAVPGLAAAGVPLAPIALPVIVAPPIALPIPRIVPGLAGGGGGGGGAGSLPGPRVDPGTKSLPPRAGREPAPVAGNGNVAVPTSYRVGYAEYLRTAGVTQIAAVAVPGVAGIMLLTGAGGLLGYRQARSVRLVRAAGTARFID